MKLTFEVETGRNVIVVRERIGAYGTGDGDIVAAGKAELAAEAMKDVFAEMLLEALRPAMADPFPGSWPAKEGTK